jgi:adenosylhomocysteine nucleosidase
MIIINQAHSFSAEEVLFTFALPSEAADIFPKYNHLICGIGKINATYNLLKEIQDKKPSVIINLGSAGSKHFKKGEVVCCTKFIQRDMNVMGLGYAQYETPLSGLPPIVEYGLQMEGLPHAVCGTGDNFEMAHITTDYHVVDMEAYALAVVAMKESLPFCCLKYISDGADGAAAEDWMVQVHKAALAFEHILKLKKR